MTRRRAPNEGTIRKRADGRWEAVLHLGYSEGRRVRKSFYGTTRREVHARLVAAQRDLQMGQEPPNDRMSTARYLADWLKDVGGRVRPRTYVSYEALVRLHMLPSLGSTPLAKLSATQIRRLLNAKLTSGLSPRSVQYVHAVLRRALNDAVRSGFLMRNVALLVDSPRAIRRNVVPLSLDETRAFMTVVHGHRLEALFVVALATGLRQGELFALRWSDVDLDDATLRVANSLQRTSGRWSLVEPKSSTSRRTVALAPVASRTLRQHRARQLEERLAAADGWPADDFVFTTPVGTPLDSSNVRRVFKALLRRAGLPDLRFHDLRHQCASLLVAQGVHPRVVMETLGHSQIAVTMNTYSHVMPHLQREAADRMEELLGS